MRNCAFFVFSATTLAFLLVFCVWPLPSAPAEENIARSAAPDLKLPMPQPDSQEAWTVMPQGARPAYMGIHGGTMPVSLLVNEDGSSLFSFVGETGDDFMEALKKVHLFPKDWGDSRKPGASGLFAGNATATLPVIALAGKSGLHGQLQPFGLSSKPLVIEGQATKPAQSIKPYPRAKSFRLFFLPDYLQPKSKAVN